MKTQTAIEKFGSVANLAAALGITRTAVYQWGEDVPELRALQIERILSRRLAEPGTEQQAV